MICYDIISRQKRSRSAVIRFGQLAMVADRFMAAVVRDSVAATRRDVVTVAEDEQDPCGRQEEHNILGLNTFLKRRKL